MKTLLRIGKVKAVGLGAIEHSKPELKGYTLPSLRSKNLNANDDIYIEDEFVFEELSFDEDDFEYAIAA